MSSDYDADMGEIAKVSILGRIAVALEQIAVELAEQNAKGTVPEPVKAAAWRPDTNTVPQYQPPTNTTSGPFPPIGGGQPPAPWVCPVHHTSKVVPAGVSQRTGKAYDAFMACAERGCNEKPPRIGQAAPQRAMPASEGVQGRTLP